MLGLGNTEPVKQQWLWHHVWHALLLIFKPRVLSSPWRVGMAEPLRLSLAGRGVSSSASVPLSNQKIWFDSICLWEWGLVVRLDVSGMFRSCGCSTVLSSDENLGEELWLSGRYNVWALQRWVSYQLLWRSGLQSIFTWIFSPFILPPRKNCNALDKYECVTVLEFFWTGLCYTKNIFFSYERPAILFNLHSPIPGKKRVTGGR